MHENWPRGREIWRAENGSNGKKEGIIDENVRTKS
jgi:hypothetical protein